MIGSVANFNRNFVTLKARLTHFRKHILMSFFLKHAHTNLN